MNSTAKLTAIIAIICTALASCTKQNLETIYADQEDSIDKYIQNLAGGDTAPRVVHRNGSNRIVLTEGTGEELAVNGNVSFYYAGYIFSGSEPSAGNLFITNDEDTALEASWKPSSPDYNILTLNIGDKDVLVKGLREGLVGVKAGEMCYIVFSGKYGFGNKTVGTIPANSPLIYKIRVDSISND